VAVDGEPDQRALEQAYAYLGQRDRTEVEVRRQLERHGASEASIDYAVDTLREQGYLDDARFARLFAEDKRNLEDWGSERIRRRLRERGVDRELIEDTLAAELGEDDLGRAVELLRRRFPAPPRDRRERDRALGVMLRKGYDSETAVDALAAYAREG
jgi:regulatory protein